MALSERVWVPLEWNDNVSVSVRVLMGRLISAQNAPAGASGRMIAECSEDMRDTYHATGHTVHVCGIARETDTRFAVR